MQEGQITSGLIRNTQPVLQAFLKHLQQILHSFLLMYCARLQGHFLGQISGLPLVYVGHGTRHLHHCAKECCFQNGGRNGSMAGVESVVILAKLWTRSKKVLFGAVQLPWWMQVSSSGNWSVLLCVFHLPYPFSFSEAFFHQLCQQKQYWEINVLN